MKTAFGFGFFFYFSLVQRHINANTWQIVYLYTNKPYHYHYISGKQIMVESGQLQDKLVLAVRQIELCYSKST